MKYLANENFPRAAVESLRASGADVEWVRTSAPGIDDASVLARSSAANQVLLTFDKDFGELAFRVGQPAACGIVLFRISLSDLEPAIEKITRVLFSRNDWPGHFSVIDEDRIRMRALPQTPTS